MSASWFFRRWPAPPATPESERLTKALNACRSDYEALEADAARVVRAYLRGEGLDEAVSRLMENGREKWWESP